MLTQLEIVNGALMLLGQEPITAMADLVKAARVATAAWPSARNECLRAHPWNFSTKRAILAENLLTYSEQFDNSAWTKSNSSATANTQRAPDGTTTADTLTDASGSAGIVYQAFTCPDDTQARTFAVYLKQGSATETRIRITYSGGSSSIETYCDITWASTPGTSGSTSGDITDAGDGWWRISVSASNDGTGHTSCICQIYPAGATAASTGTVFAWGASLNNAATVGDYATTTSANIRPFTPKFGFTRGFAVPSDFVRYVKQDDLDIPYQVEGGSILTDEASVELVYLYHDTDPLTWDTQFDSLMEARMAAQMAKTLTGDVGLMFAMYRLYDSRKGEGQFADSKENEQPSETYEGHTWLAARGGG